MTFEDMTELEKSTFLRFRGWSQWYSNNYWVNPKTVADRSKQDYTNYGMSIDDAINYDLFGNHKFKGSFLGYMGGPRW